MEELILRLQENNLIDFNGNIILVFYENGSQQIVDQQTFQIFFGDCTDMTSYACMSGSHTFMWGDPPVEYTMTALQLGYQGYFDQWKPLGILI